MKNIIKNIKLFKKIRRGLINFFTAGHLIFSLKTELKSGKPEKGISFLRKKYPIIKPRSVLFLIELYSYLVTLKNSFVWEGDNKKKLIIHFCCWGDNYAEKARDYLLPSLLAKNNLPAIFKEYTINLFVHCDTKTKADLESLVVLAEIKKYAAVNIIALPDRLVNHYQSLTRYPDFSLLKDINRSNRGLRYLLLGALQANALKDGIQHQALVSFLMPDSILSDSFYFYALSKIEGKKLILTTTFRTNYKAVRKHLAKFYVDDSKAVCSVSGAELSKLQVEYLHDTEQRRVISEETTHFLACARFIFKSKEGLLLRALHYHPILVDCGKIANDLKIDYFPIDDSILKRVLEEDNTPYEEQVWICSDPAMMNFMELSDPNPEVNEPPIFLVPSTYASLLNSIYLLIRSCPMELNEKMNRFFIQNELKFSAGEGYNDETAVIDSEKFLLDLYARIDSE